MAFYYGNTIHLLFSLRSFRKHRKSSSTLNVQLKSVAKILFSVILFFLPFKKWYFQIQIRKLNPQMSTLTWTTLKVCSYDTQSYARECVTWSIEDISRIDEVCYTWLYQIPTFFFNSIATARLKTPLGIMQIFPRFQNKSLIATFSVARIHSSVGPNDFRTSWVS